MKKTPLSRGTKQMKRSPMKRTAWKKKPTKKKTAQKKTPKIWKTSRADQTFSLYIRARDGRCRKCGTVEGLTCSHFWRRGISATRFDLDNCIALCVWCHIEWETKKNLEYKLFMVDWLGIDKYNELEIRARSFKQRSDAVREWQILYTELSTSTLLHSHDNVIV